MMLILSADIFNENTKYNKMLKNITTQKDMMKLIFKRYNMHFFHFDVNKDINHRINYPLEMIYIM